MSFGKPFFRGLGIFCIAMLYSTVALSQNSVLEQAKALFGQKKYEDVLSTLKEELDRQTPDVEAMKLAMEANMMTGRPMSASALATELLKRTANKDLDLVYRAGEIAEICGESKLALSRYHTYMTKAKTRGPKMDKAVSYLISHASYPDAYIQATESFGPELYWSGAQSLISRLIEERSITDLATLLKNTIQTYGKNPEVLANVYQLLFNNRGRFSKDDHAKLVEVLVSTKLPGDGLNWHLNQYLRDAYNDMDNGKKLRWGLNYAKTNKNLLPDELFMAPAIQYIGSRANKEQQLQTAREIVEILPLILESGNKDSLRSLALNIANLPETFKTLVTPEQMASLVNAYAKKSGYGYDHDGYATINAIVNTFYKDDKANQAKFLKEIMPSLNDSNNLVNFAIGLQPEGGKSMMAAYLAPVEGFQRDLREFDILTQLRLNDVKAKYQKALRNYLASGIGTEQFLINEIVHQKYLTTDEKIKLVTEAAQLSGSNARLSAVIKAMESNDAKLKENAAFKALKTYADQKKSGSDAALTAANKVFDIASKEQNAAALDAAAGEFLKAYKGPVPASKLLAKNLQEYVAYRVLNHCLGVKNNAQALNQFVQRWTPRITGPGPVWDNLIQLAWNKEGQNHKGKMLYQILRDYTKAVAATLKDGAVLGRESFYANQINPAKQDVSIMAPLYADYPAVACSYIWQNGYEWTPDFYFKQLEEILKDPKGKLTLADLAKIQDNVSNGPHKAVIPEKFPVLLMNKTMDLAKKENRIDFEQESKIYTMFKDGNADYLKEYAKRMKERTPYQQMMSVSQFISSRNPDRKNGMQFLNDVLKPLLASWPQSQWKQVPFSGSLFLWLYDAGKDEKNPEKASAEAMTAALSAALLDGNARLAQGGWKDRVGEALESEYTKRLASSSDPSVLSRNTGMMAQYLADDNNQNRGMGITDRIYKAMAEKTPGEIQYLFLSILADGNGNFNKAVKSKYTLTMSKLAKDIPGILPVDKNDQAYDLFVASQLYREGNALNAWALVRPKTAILRDRWKELDYDFVIWALEQTRKQKMYKEALEIAMTMWLDEQLLSPEDAARLAIIKGDIYRDQKNFAAAKIEYESLKNTARYQKTYSGSMAKFRLVELMLLSEDYTGARLELERLEVSSNQSDRAEAYYLLARLEFQQQNYDGAVDYLKEVFKLNYGHAEARLLSAEVDLARKVIKDPNVKIGLSTLRTTAIPGKELTFQIQDNNLSIVRGGKSIPIIVTTTVGKDTEKLELLPNANDTNLFTGVLQTALGKAVPGNLLLELTGSDEIIYQIDPEFQKANGLDYPSKKLDLKSEGKLYASSKKILTEAEQEDLAMAAALAISAGIRDRNANSRVVRPGSPIYIRVVDPDMSKTPGKPDTLTVNLSSSSGDELTEFVLTETGPYTGVFEGIVKTGIPYPNAKASDQIESVDVNAVINSRKTGTWKSLSDGQKPKWIEVDTMTSSNFKEIEIGLPDPKTIKSFTLTASLDKENDIVCTYPQNSKEKNNGGLTVNILGGAEARLDVIRRRFLHARPTEFWIKEPVFKREFTNQNKGRDGWFIYDISGPFWLEENEEIEFKFLQEPQQNQEAYLLIDNKLVIGGTMNEAGLSATRTLFLTKGLHQLQVFGRGYSKDTQVIVGMAQKGGDYQPLPEDWFNPEKYPSFAEALKPKGKVTEIKDGFRIVLDEPARYRKLRWTFDDFSGSQVEVSRISAKDDKGNSILPVENDLSTGKTNDILEIPADDKITITYKDEKNLDENKSILSVTLSSSFHNADIGMFYEEIRMTEEGYPVSTLVKAKRVQKGDSVIVRVQDFDEDTSEESQTVPVEISTTSGEKLKLELLETKMGGVFSQVFKVGDKTGNGVIKVQPGDTITARFLDKENNSPGIPIFREYMISGIEGTKPVLTVFKTKINMIEDKSPAARAKIQLMKDRGDKREDIKIYKEDILATPMRLPKNAPKDTPVIVNSKAPLLMELSYPEVAKHWNSKAEILVLTDTEINAANAEGRQPKPLIVSAPLESLSSLARKKGYPVTLETGASMSPDNILDMGIFAAVVRLQLGSAGDELNDVVSSNETFNLLSADFRTDDSAFKVPTVIVSGSDTITVSVNDKSGQELVRQIVKLRSDGEIGLYDKNFLTLSDSVHIGQNFYVRVYDPDRDVSNDLDSVKVNVVSEAGDKLVMTLSETLPHSGIFTGVLKTEYMPKPDAEGKVPPKTEENILRTVFGDTVTFTYTDELPLDGDKPVDMTATGKVVIGSDGEVSTFTKKFKDPDMAVKTNFLMAEALFEMAKSHRAMKKDDLAREEIARGKRILEEALRDYPNTSLKAQGEFLLANLAQQLENYQEAIGRYSVVISTWPESEYAIKSQFQKAQCLEKMGQGLQACEEYVKLTYLYPDSSLAPDAKIRLGNYYYKNKNFKSASTIFRKFTENHPDHPLAAKSLFLAGNAELRNQLAIEKLSKENNQTYNPDYTDAIKIFTELVDKFQDDKDLRAEAMYWLGDSYFKTKTVEGQEKSYQIFKRLTWDYPETKWAKIVRGRLAEQPSR